MTTINEASAGALLKISRPQLIPEAPFPSYFRNKDEGGNPFSPLLPFASWSFEDYPIHSASDRMNLVASGRVDSPTCCWPAEDVMALPQRPNGLVPHAPKGDDH